MRRFGFAALVLIGGCALLQPPPATVEAPLRSGEILSAEAGAKAITVGKSTKADVHAALGEALVIDFESGYEVWVYRERPQQKAMPPRTELVLLFAPSGVLSKKGMR